MRIGVDAFNLSADRRGMGRIVRHNLESLQKLREAAVVLIARTSAQAHDLLREFPFEYRTVNELRGAKLDAVWYPWNGMRFAPHASAIVTINDPFAFTFPHRNIVARWREQSPIRRAIREADRIFTISQWGANELARLFGVPPDRIAACIPGIDAFWHQVDVRGAEPYMLFVAGPDERKNAATLFAAYDRAHAEHPLPPLVVAGALNDKDERLFEGLRAPRRRVHPGDDQLRELYAGAIAVVVPSYAEGFGLPAVEAMACGAPVIASDTAALPEACDGAAILVSPHDTAAWVDALWRVASDEDLRSQLRERGLQRVARIDPDGPAKLLLGSVRRLIEAGR